MAVDHQALTRLVAPLRVKPGTKIALPKGFDPAHKARFASEADAADALENSRRLLADYQSKLAAQSTYALLVVLQALDAGGKDGTVKHVMSGVNPAGVRVHSFKVPSVEELNHDYLWRYENALPERGTIGIFNRSHYEEVLVVRVHPENLEREHLPPGARTRGVWARRFREINDWERYLVDNGIHIVKLFLNVSRDEQCRRLLARIDEPSKNWKFSMADVEERRCWDDYQRAYSDVLTETSTEWAPWHVIPADHKWFARLASAAAIVEALRRIDPRYPTIDKAKREELARARMELDCS
jgi:PPK2 family polyphosphate:nucleotide phosphotransferase